MFNILLLLTVNSPRGVDPDDANVAEKNALFVLLVLARAAFLSPVGCVGELRQGALLLRRACNREGRSWKTQVEEGVRHTSKMLFSSSCSSTNICTALLCPVGWFWSEMSQLPLDELKKILCSDRYS